jgi:preprotein translocase subunit YajC
MSIHDLKRGDRVQNSYGAHGEVASITDAAVTIAYSDRGGRWTSKHDGAWFKKYSGMITKVRAGTRG